MAVQRLLIDVRRPNYPVAGIQAVIDADHLDTDLSGFEIVADEKLAHLNRTLEEVALELRDKFIRHGLATLEARSAPFSLDAKIRWRKSVSGAAASLVAGGATLMAATGDLALGTFLLGSPLLVCASVASASLLGGQVFEPEESTHQKLRAELSKRLVLGTHAG